MDKVKSPHHPAKHSTTIDVNLASFQHLMLHLTNHTTSTSFAQAHTPKLPISQTKAGPFKNMASQPATAAAAADFKFPQEYFFPAFFTRQTNLTTHHAQLRTWSALVLAYARHHRLFRLRLSEAAESDLFCHRRLERRLQAPDIRELVDAMVRDGSAEYAVGGTAAAQDGERQDVVLVYWKKPEEWAALVEAYVEDTAQKGSVLTVYELSEGDGTRNTGMFFLLVVTTTCYTVERPVLMVNKTELHGIDSEVLRKALNILVKRGKAQIFGQEDSLGVKFF